MKDIVFVCGTNDFHAMDKYWLTSKVIYPRKVLILTDSVERDNNSKPITDTASVFQLFNINKLLIRNQSSFGNRWRNLFKLIVIPLQVYYLKKFYKNHPDHIYHAIPMYYMLLCYISKVPFVGTPQGSEILVRPGKSKIYEKYARRSLQAATRVIVDSVQMAEKVKILSGVDAVVMKNGFNTTELMNRSKFVDSRYTILSMRGLNPHYRISEILKVRAASIEKLPISLAYPFWEKDYKQNIESRLIEGDRDLGRLDKNSLYQVMARTLLAISIPLSDSSPRSVYECIFAGACVAATYSPYLDELPNCMRERIFVVNLERKNWFDEALKFAREMTLEPFIPSKEALEMCNEEITIRKIVKEIYNY